MTKLRHIDDGGTARFVTFSCYRHLPCLSTPRIRDIAVEELRRVAQKYDIRILGFVIMPDHVHLVLWPPDGTQLGRVIGEMKSLSARRVFSEQTSIQSGKKRVLWQRRCYDHNCRTPEVVKEKIKYCHGNPMRAGLVSSLADWRWSSYNCYEGNKDVLLDIDIVEFRGR
ncbi:MAG: transposase [candidate division Zixibacteria bacterium]|nr:transposase [candidate division Zixibacteria bacterium]